MQNRRADIVPPDRLSCYCTASFSTLPGRNFGCELALICIGSPVRGLRPVDAFRRVTEKLPKPTSRTSSPRFRVDVITSSIVSTARKASLRLSPARSATWPINSCLFMGPTLPSSDARLTRPLLQPFKARLPAPVQPLVTDGGARFGTGRRNRRLGRMLVSVGPLDRLQRLGQSARQHFVDVADRHDLERFLHACRNLDE